MMIFLISADPVHKVEVFLFPKSVKLYHLRRYKKASATQNPSSYFCDLTSDPIFSRRLYFREIFAKSLSFLSIQTDDPIKYN